MLVRGGGGREVSVPRVVEASEGGWRGGGAGAGGNAMHLAPGAGHRGTCGHVHQQGLGFY